VEGNLRTDPRNCVDQPDLAGVLSHSLRRLVRHQIALHDKLQCTITFHIHGVSLFALHGRKDRDDGTAVQFVLVDDIADSKFGH
jgi:hypothetical protein